MGKMKKKDLVFLKVRWNPSTCVHVISQIGFGIGGLKVTGGSKGLTKDFVLPPLGNSTKVYIFKGSVLRSELKFPWFMLRVICLEKPWMCPDMRYFASPSDSRPYKYRTYSIT